MDKVYARAHTLACRVSTHHTVQFSARCFSFVGFCLVWLFHLTQTLPPPSREKTPQPTPPLRLGQQRQALHTPPHPAPSAKCWRPTTQVL